MRLLVLLISFAMLVFSLLTVLDYWRYDERLQDVAQLMQQKVDAADIHALIESAIAAENPEEARMYLSIARTFGHAVSPQHYLSRIEALETPWQETRRQVTRFADGFIDGSAESAAGVAGAITADFTVVGDVRDLNAQYDLYRQGENVNELIVTLAGVGVGLTAATVMSGGSAAPAKSGVSALKIAGRAGKLTPKLQRLLLRQGKSVFDYQGFLLALRGERSLAKVQRAAVKAYNPRAVGALADTAQRVNVIRGSTSLTDTINLLRYVENADDLRRLERVSRRYGGQTKGILKLVGKAGIGTIRVLRRSTELLVGLIAAMISLLATLFSVASFFRR
ncbi:MAG: hypothetical protein ACPG51_07255 [Thiolinea sp.]